MDGLKALSYSLGRVRSIYGELWVANKLIDLNPKIGKSRKYTSADIYLEKIDKLIEVKGCERGIMTGCTDFLWTFGIKQIDEEKFDYAVLLGYGKNSYKPHKVFIMSFEELKELLEYPERKDLITKGSTYISYFEEYKDYLKAVKNNEIEYVKIEEELNKHPEKFENRWDKIK